MPNLRTARATPDLLKALAILSNTTVRRSAVDQEGIKSYWKSDKGRIYQAYYLQVFERLY